MKVDENAYIEIKDLQYVFNSFNFTVETILDLNRLAYIIVSETVSHGSISHIHNIIYDDTSKLYRFLTDMKLLHKRILNSHIENVMLDIKGEEVLVEEVLRDMDESGTFVAAMKELGDYEVLIWADGMKAVCRKVVPW